MKTFTGLFLSAFLVSAVFGLSPWPQSPLKSSPGQSYVYNYNARIVTGISKLDSTAAALGLKAKIVLQPESESRILMQLSDIRVGKHNGQISEHLDGQIVFDHEVNKDYERELSKPIRMTVVAGQIKAFEAQQDEEEWSINIKKSILASISTVMQPEKIIRDLSSANQKVNTLYAQQQQRQQHYGQGQKLVFFPVYEDGIDGICETVYQIHQAPNMWGQEQAEASTAERAQVYNVTKVRNYRNCLTELTIEKSNIDVRGAPVACRQGKSFPVVDGYYPQPEDETHLAGCPYGQTRKDSAIEQFSYTKYNVSMKQGNTQIDSLYTEGKTVYATNGRHIVIFVKQNMTLEQVAPNAQVGQISAPAQAQIHQELSYRLPREVESQSQEIPYYNLFGKVNQEELLEIIPELLKSVAQDIAVGEVHEEKKTMQKVVELANAMAVLESQNLEKLYHQVAKIGRSDRASEHQQIVRKLFVDLLGATGTTDAALLAKKLYEKDELTTQEAKEIFEAVPQNLFLVDVKVVEAYLNLFLSQKVQAQRHLHASLGITLGKLIREATIKRAQTPGDIHDRLSIYKQRRAQSMVNTDNVVLDFKAAQQFIQQQQQRQQQQQQQQQQQSRVRRSAPWEKQFNQVELLEQDQVAKVIEIIEKALRAAPTFHQKVTLIETLAHMSLPQVLPILTPYVNNEAPLEELPGYAIEDESKIPEERNFLRQVTIYSLAHVAKQYPQQVLALLVPVYENAGEAYEVRIAAFTIMMTADPGRHLLERIASELTHESNRQVKSFVYSSLSAAANFSQPALKKLADDARIALELMPEQNFGAQYSKMISKDFYDEQKKLGWSVVADMIASNVSAIPRSAYVNIGQTSGVFQNVMLEFGYNSKGIEQILKRLVEPNGVVSDAFEAMTTQSKDRRVMKRATDSAQQALQTLKDKLNMAVRSEEEPKATIFFKLFERTSYIALDKRYLHELIDSAEDRVKDMINALVRGKSYHYVKLIMPTQLYKVVPSALGIPVVVSERHPTIVSIKINNAKLQIANSEKSVLPTGANLTVQIEPTVYHTTYQFVYALSSADKQAIGTQVEKTTRATLPVELGIGYQRAKNQLTWSIVPKVPKEMFHHFTTAKTFIAKASIAGSPKRDWLGEAVTIRAQPVAFKYQKDWLQNELGLGVQVQVETENALHAEPFYKSKTASKHGLVAAWIELVRNDDITPRKVHIMLKADEKEPVLGYDFALRYKCIEELNEGADRDDSDESKEDPNESNSDESQEELDSWYSQNRQQRLYRAQQKQQKRVPRAAEELISAEQAWQKIFREKFEKKSIKKLASDLMHQTRSVWQSTWSEKEKRELSQAGQQQSLPAFVAHDFVFTAVGRSSRSPRYYAANALVVKSIDGRNYWTKMNAFAKKFQTEQTQESEKQLCLEAIASYPAMPSEFYYEPTATQDLKAKLSAKLAYGVDCKSGVQIAIDGQMEKTEEKVFKQDEFVRQSELSASQSQDWFYQQCKIDRAEGKSLSYACERAIVEDSYFKQLVLDIQYKNVDARLLNATRKLALAAKVAFYHHLDNNQVDADNQEGKMRITAQYSNRFSNIPMANIYIQAPQENIHFEKVHVPHFRPASALRSLRQVYSDLLSGYTETDKCVLMENHIRTFDNVTLQMQQSQCQYLLAKDCSAYERFAVFSRQLDQASKTKAVTVLVDGTEIKMLPPMKTNVAQVVVDGKTTELTTEKPQIVAKNGVVILLRKTLSEAVAPLVIVESSDIDLKVHYDGKNVKVRVGGRYQGATCGLCGDNNRESEHEFAGPDGCIYKNVEDFVSSYALSGEHCEQLPIARGPKRCPKKVSEDYVKVNKYVAELKSAEKQERQYSIAARADAEELARRQQEQIERQAARQVESGQSVSSEQKTTLMGATPQQQQLMQRLRTYTLERANEICFSVQPVVACIQGVSRPSDLSIQQLSFHCLPNHSVSAQRLADQARYRTLALFGQKSVDLVQNVHVPVACVAA